MFNETFVSLSAPRILLCVNLSQTLCCLLQVLNFISLSFFFYSNDAFENACIKLDEVNLKPTYKILWAVSGFPYNLIYSP